MGLFTGRSERASNLPQMVDEAINGRDRALGGSPVPVGWAGAMAIPAVWAAVRLRANLISTCPVDVYRRLPDGSAQRVGSPTVLQTPAAGGTDIVSWLHASQVSLDLRGNAFGIIVDRDPVTLLPRQIELQHPDSVAMRLDDGQVSYYRVGQKRYEPADVWHERQNDMPGSPLGMSPIAAAARSLGINLAAEQFGADFFRDGAHPSALLSSEAPLDEGQAKVAKRRFLDTIRGREPLVLGGNWSFAPLSVAPSESQFLEVMRFGVEQVARIFDLPAEMVGGASSGSSITYANTEQRAQDFLAYRFGTTIARRERALSRLTPRGQFVKLNTAALLRTDLMTRYKSYELGLKNGFLSLDEVRGLEDRPPMTAEQLQALKDAGLLGKPASINQPGTPPALPTEGTP